MKEFNTKINHDKGLHSRPASKIVNHAKKFECNITIQYGKKEANAKSMVSILKLGAKEGATVRVMFDGSDEDRAFENLKSLFDEEIHKTDIINEDKLQISPIQDLTVDDEILNGLPASSGIVTGPVYHWKQPESVVYEQEEAYETAEEKEQLFSAIAKAKVQLATLRERIANQVGNTEASIFDAQLEFFEDPEILEIAHSEIVNGSHAAAAWQKAIDLREEQLSASEDKYMAARAADIRDIGNQVIRILSQNDQNERLEIKGSVILIADDLSPSDAVSIDSSQLLGICTVNGSPSSHTAILARALGIPALVKVDKKLLTLSDGLEVILDGDKGQLIINPKSEKIHAAKQKEHKQRRSQNEQLKEASKKAVSRDGKKIKVVANIASLEDAEKVNQFGGEGVGLLRTEFLFQNRSVPPTEEEQYRIYRDIVLSQGSKPVIIRTFDAGSDKPVKFLHREQEINPALGQRGIRLRNDFEDIFKTQIRAVLRTAEIGHVGIMFPMITTIEEWKEINSLMQGICRELEVESVDKGIMVEVPAAALNSHAFAGEVDFFSIGTNDLAQYTLAMDRMNPKLAPQLKDFDPSIFRLISETVNNAHKAGKWVGVCGEIASNPKAIPILIGLGVDELSVNIPAIPEVKAVIRNMEFSKAKQLADKVLGCSSSSEIRKLLSHHKS